jgi:hypothetical protein
LRILLQFILSPKYKGFCNVAIYELQFASSDRDPWQRGVVINYPGRVTIERVTKTG